MRLPDRQKPHGYKEPDYPYKLVPELKLAGRLNVYWVPPARPGEELAIEGTNESASSAPAGRWGKAMGVSPVILDAGAATSTMFAQDVFASPFGRAA